MKYLKLNIQLLLAFVIVLGLFSCTDEDAVDNGKKEIKEGLPTTVSLKLTSATPMVVETKTADDGGKFGVINDLAILVYNAETELLDEVTCVSLSDTEKGQSWHGQFKATTGKRRVYVLANSGLRENAIKNIYDQESNLLKEELINAGTMVPEGNEQMLGFVRSNSGDFKNVLSIDDTSETITISESNDETTGVEYYSHLYPPYSKITFTVKNEVKTDMSEKVQLNITNVYVRNLPRKYSLLPVKNILKTSGTEDNDVFSGKVEQVNQGEDLYEFYMFENVQGNINKGNKDSKLKSPFEGDLPSHKSNFENDYSKWDTKWATKTPCTYIEVEGTYAIWKSDTQYGAGKIHYRFFLGANTVDNFDIERNTHYKVELRFTGIAGYNELDYEWRVNAQLSDVTIVPEGILEIDGSPDYWFPFAVINGSDKSVDITTDQGTSNLKIQYLVPGTSYYPTYWSNASQIENIGSHSYTEYHIKANEFGIIGSAGYSSGENRFIDDNGNSYSEKSDNLNKRVEIRQGLIYLKRKYVVNTNPSTDYYIKMYPLLCLSSSYETSNNETVYAQRFDRNEGLVTESEMKKICTGNYVDNGNMYVLPPRVQDLELMIQYETYPTFKPKTVGPYWTTEGLYYWEEGGMRKATSETTGYVRCTYRSNSK